MSSSSKTLTCTSHSPPPPIAIFLDQWFSKWGPQTNIISITWELVIKVNPQTPPQTTESKRLGPGPRNLHLISPSGNSDEYGNSSNLVMISCNSVSISSILPSMCSVFLAHLFYSPSFWNPSASPRPQFLGSTTFSLVLTPLTSLLPFHPATHLTALWLSSSTSHIQKANNSYQLSF